MRNANMEEGSIHKDRHGCLLEVIKYESSRKILVEFKDANRYQKWTDAKAIRLGSVKNPYHPHDVNVLTTTTKAKRGKYPIGVYLKKDVGKFRAQLGTYGGFQKLLIESHDPNECFSAYKVAKEQYMKEVGEQWEGKLDPRVITSLKNWVVKETD